MSLQNGEPNALNINLYRWYISLSKMLFVIGKGEQKLPTIQKIFIKWPVDVKSKINATEVNCRSLNKEETVACLGNNSSCIIITVVSTTIQEEMATEYKLRNGL